MIPSGSSRIERDVANDSFTRVALLSPQMPFVMVSIVAHDSSHVWLWEARFAGCGPSDRRQMSASDRPRRKADSPLATNPRHMYLGSGPAAFRITKWWDERPGWGRIAAIHNGSKRRFVG
jgi:hypothetical protein